MAYFKKTSDSHLMLDKFLRDDKIQSGVVRAFQAPLKSEIYSSTSSGVSVARTLFQILVQKNKSMMSVLTMFHFIHASLLHFFIVLPIRSPSEQEDNSCLKKYIKRVLTLCIVSHNHGAKFSKKFTKMIGIAKNYMHAVTFAFLNQTTIGSIYKPTKFII